MTGGPSGADALAVVLQAIADPVRLQVVETLSRAPRRAGDLAREVGVPAPTMSKHLRLLLAAGVIEDERGRGDARVRVFHLRTASVVAVRAWLCWWPGTACTARSGWCGACPCSTRRT